MKKIKAALVSLGSQSSKWTIEAMSKYFDEVESIRLQEIEVSLGERHNAVLYRGQAMPHYDCMYVKGSFRYSAVLRSVTGLTSKQTYIPIEASAFIIGHDKLLTHQILEEEGIPMPKTYIAPTVEAAKRVLTTVHYPIVLKFPQGTQGKGVMFADSYASATSFLDALAALNQPCIIQEYIETDGSDIRAFVIGEKVVASMKRKALKGDKRSNIHAGGIGEPYELDNFTRKIAIKAAKAVKAEICGVDILESPTGPKVIEVNLSPGLQGITKATGVDVADKIAKFLYDKTLEKLGKENEISGKKILADEGIKDVHQLNEIITTLDFRGSRVLLPESVTRMANISEAAEYIISIDKEEIKIKKFIL